MSSILEGAFDLHVHASPDVVPRAADLVDLARAAREAGMAGIGLKDHLTSTVGRCHALNRLFPDGPRFYSSIVLNPAVGGLNPAAVEAALGAGADIVYFPTHAAAHHVDTLGPDVTPVPHPASGVQRIEILDEIGKIRSVVGDILDEIARHDAVLATGHISPRESLALLEEAARRGVRRMVVTHASESVPGMSVGDQRRAVELGALIEHCFLAATSCCPGNIPLEVIAEQIRQVGSRNVILSSDFGQPENGPPVEAFATHVERLEALGVSEEEIRHMLRDNPRRLVERD